MFPSELITEIHNLDASNHIVIGTILRKYPKVKLNENANGIMVNVSTLPAEVISEITQYMEFLKTQQNVLSEIEKETNDCKRIIDIEPVDM
jgi:hypothetical protein